jgi:hypothetical protein
MKLVSPERLAQHYPNKYIALNVAALEARRFIEGMHKDEIRLTRSPYDEALEAVMRGDLKFAKLTEADIEALAREGFDEPVFRRPIL